MRRLGLLRPALDVIATRKGAAGEGPPVVYVPGIDGTGELLLGTAGRLEERFRLIRLCYSAGEEADSYPALAASAAAAIREANVSSCLVIAESFGGAVALQLALDHPALIAGLMIVNSFAYYPSRARLSYASWTAPLIPEPLFHFGRRLFAPPALFGKRRDEQAIADFRALPGTFFDEAYRRRLAMIAELDLRPRLAELTLPVALYASAEDRVVPSLEASREMAAELPEVTLEVLPSAGHLVLPLAEECWPERVEALAERTL